MTEPTSILPIDHTRLNKFKGEWETHLKELEDLPCTNEEEKAHWSQWLGFVQAGINALEEERKQLVAPINEDLKEANVHYARAEYPAKEAKDLIKRKLNEYAEACLKLEKELLATAATQAQAGNTEAVQEALSSLPDTQKVKGSSTKFVWAWKLVDYHSVPESWKTINDKALDETLKHIKNDTPPNIPGIEFYQKAKTSAR